MAERISSSLSWLCSWEFAAALRDSKPKFDAAGFKLITIGVGPPSKAQVLAEKVVFVLWLPLLQWCSEGKSDLCSDASIVWAFFCYFTWIQFATFCGLYIFSLWFLFVVCGSYPFLLNAFMPILTTRFVAHWIGIGIGIYLAKYCFLYYWFSFICTSQICPFYTQLSGQLSCKVGDIHCCFAGLGVLLTFMWCIIVFPRQAYEALGLYHGVSRTFLNPASVSSDLKSEMWKFLQTQFVEFTAGSSIVLQNSDRMPTVCRWKYLLVWIRWPKLWKDIILMLCLITQVPHFSRWIEVLSQL